MEDAPVKLLSNDFLKRYPDHPAHMTQLGLFTFYRTYARFLPERGRRETWKETVARAVEYNVGLDEIHRAKLGLPIPRARLTEEARSLFDNVFNLRQFPSGRTLWVGGTQVARDYPMANFNCSFTNIEKWDDLCELFYLLMLGSGVGFKCTPEMAKRLSPIRVNTRLILSPYNPVPVDYRLEHTDVRHLENGFAKIYVGDSKEGWRDALGQYLLLLTDPRYEHVHTIKVSFNSVRPKGERLKTFGGTASGPEPLKEMFAGIDAVLKNQIDASLAPIEHDARGYGRVRPIHILDIGNLIGNNVVAGGVRRTAEIFLFDPDDMECLFAKYGVNGFWSERHFAQHEKVKRQLEKMGIEPPAWFGALSERHVDPQVGGGAPFNPGRPGIGHRRLSNNSMALTSKPSPDMLHLIFLMIELDGEPGFINLEAARRRRDNAEGVNPCGEILLDSKQQCNLTTVNLCAFRTEDGFDLEAARRAQALSARAGLRMTLIDLELNEWNEKHKRDRLTGCSLTGVQDAFAGMDEAGQDAALESLSSVAREAAAQYAHELRIPSPLLVTTIKPEGTLSLVAGGVSAGLHNAHAPYFIRRIRVSSDDALAKAALEFNWKLQPEVGTVGGIENARTLVLDFPVKSRSRVTKGDVPALSQLARYIQFQRHYTQHNSSNTITVKPDEWPPIERAIAEVWDDFVGVAFLAYDGGTYQLAPYEEITREHYEALSKAYSPFDPAVLTKYESVSIPSDAEDDDCVNGACPVR
ncbi:ribonucleoside-triphosphate reductase, adenosylcobalamin-dependent [Bacillota bacterium Meth-B3]